MLLLEQGNEKFYKPMKYKVYGVITPIDFGRYKGKTLLEIASEDKKYLEEFYYENNDPFAKRDVCVCVMTALWFLYPLGRLTHFLL